MTAEDIDARVSVVEARVSILTSDVSALRTTVEGHSVMAAERGQALRNLAESMVEIKTTLNANSTALQSLSAGSGMLGQKVTWIVGILLFVANMLGQSAGGLLKQILNPGVAPPAIVQHQK